MEQYERAPEGEKPFNCHHYFMTNPSLSGRGGALEVGDVPKLALRKPVPHIGAVR